MAKHHGVLSSSSKGSSVLVDTVLECSGKVILFLRAVEPEFFVLDGPDVARLGLDGFQKGAQVLTVMPHNLPGNYKEVGRVGTKTNQEYIRVEVYRYRKRITRQEVVRRCERVVTKMLWNGLPVRPTGWPNGATGYDRIIASLSNTDVSRPIKVLREQGIPQERHYWSVLLEYLEAYGWYPYDDVRSGHASGPVLVNDCCVEYGGIVEMIGAIDGQ